LSRWPVLLVNGATRLWAAHSEINGLQTSRVALDTSRIRYSWPTFLKQEDAAAKQDDLELAPRLLDQRGRHLTHRPSDGDPHHVNKSPASFSRGGGGFVAGYVHAPRANRTTSNVFREEDALQKIDPAGHDRLAAAANKSPGDNAVSLFSYSPQQARPSEINALSYRDLQSQ